MKAKFVMVFLVLFSGYSAFSMMTCNPPTPAQIQRSQNFLANTPCSPVVAACNTGGYILGCHRANGKGLEDDCLRPLKHGQAVAGVAMQPTDPAVTACKAAKLR